MPKIKLVTLSYLAGLLVFSFPYLARSLFFGEKINNKHTFLLKDSSGYIEKNKSIENITYKLLVYSVIIFDDKLFFVP